MFAVVAGGIANQTWVSDGIELIFLCFDSFRLVEASSSRTNCVGATTLLCMHMDVDPPSSLPSFEKKARRSCWFVFGLRDREIITAIGSIPTRNLLMAIEKQGFCCSCFIRFAHGLISTNDCTVVKSCNIINEWRSARSISRSWIASAVTNLDQPSLCFCFQRWMRHHCKRV
jgi:hypothetical protein